MAWQWSNGEVLTASNLNAVTIPWNARCQVRMSAPQSLTSSSSTALSFDTEDYDPLGWHAGGTPTLITPTIAGWYRATLSTQFQSDTDYVDILLEIQKGGVALTPPQTLRITGAATTWVPGLPLQTVLVQLNGSSENLRAVARQQNTSAGANTVNAALLVELVVPT